MLAHLDRSNINTSTYLPAITQRCVLKRIVTLLVSLLFGARSSPAASISTKTPRKRPAVSQADNSPATSPSPSRKLAHPSSNSPSSSPAIKQADNFPTMRHSTSRRLAHLHQASPAFKADNSATNQPIHIIPERLAHPSADSPSTLRYSLTTVRPPDTRQPRRLAHLLYIKQALL